MLTLAFSCCLTHFFGNGFLLPAASIYFWTTLVLYLVFKEWITPWYVGCKADFVLRGRENISIDFNTQVSECAVQLSTTSATFRSFFSNWSPSSLTHSSKSCESI